MARLVERRRQPRRFTASNGSLLHLSADSEQHQAGPECGTGWTKPSTPIDGGTGAEYLRRVHSLRSGECPVEVAREVIKLSCLPPRLESRSINPHSNAMNATATRSHRIANRRTTGIVDATAGIVEGMPRQGVSLTPSKSEGNTTLGPLAQFMERV